MTCSGVYQDGSLRVVRNGVGINEQAAVELPGVKGLWALKTDAASAHDAFLVVSFISETRILAMNIEAIRPVQPPRQARLLSRGCVTWLLLVACCPVELLTLLLPNPFRTSWMRPRSLASTATRTRSCAPVWRMGSCSK